MSRGLELIRAVDIIPHVQFQSGAIENLQQGVFPDRGLLQNDDRILVVQLIGYQGNNTLLFEIQWTVHLVN